MMYKANEALTSGRLPPQTRVAPSSTATLTNSFTFLYWSSRRKSFSVSKNSLLEWAIFFSSNACDVATIIVAQRVLKSSPFWLFIYSVNFYDYYFDIQYLKPGTVRQSPVKLQYTHPLLEDIATGPRTPMSTSQYHSMNIPSYHGIVKKNTMMVCSPPPCNEISRNFTTCHKIMRMFRNWCTHNDSRFEIECGDIFGYR